VFKFRSVNNIVIAPASEVNKSIAVTKMAHTNSGILSRETFLWCMLSSLDSSETRGRKVRDRRRTIDRNDNRRCRRKRARQHAKAARVDLGVKLNCIAIRAD